jgi:cytochrome P450
VRYIPGPYFARVSRFPLQYAVHKRRRTEYVTKLLAKYGPIVVIAPDQIHTTDDAAMKTIYEKSSIKTKFYASMGSWKGVTSTLGFLDYASAAPSRNALIQCFQNKNLATLVESIESHVDDFLALLDKKCVAKDKVDGVVVFRLLALDIVTDVLWGEKTRLLHSFDEQDTPAFVRRFHAFSTWNAVKSFIPGADFFVRTCGSKKWRALRRDCNDMDVTARSALERWKTRGKDGTRDKDVLSMLGNMSSNAVPLDDMPAYMIEMMAAGSSTTSHTAAFTCWHLTRHPDVQAALHAELVAAFPDLENVDIRKTTDLALLDAVIRETMRLHPMIPGPQERILGKDVEIASKRVKAGVIASTAPYNQGRLPHVFPEPDAWQPQRWKDPTDAMKLNWLAFGTGSRACPGSNLAMTELKYIIGMIFRRFEAVMPEGGDEDELLLGDVFAAGTRSGHCWLKFEKVEA